MDIWDGFMAFVEAVLATAAVHVGNEAHRSYIQDALKPVPSMRSEASAFAIKVFFANVPAHWAAVNGLDHMQFVRPLYLGGNYQIRLCSLLDPFSKLGPVPHGQVWLPLVRLAHSVMPGQIDIDASVAGQRKEIKTGPWGTRTADTPTP